MIYTEAQLDRLCNPPPRYQTDQVIRTHERIRRALNNHIPKDRLKEQYNLSGFNVNVCLQGSYKNSTNIRNSSDVDVVAEFTSVNYYDISFLTPEEEARFERNRNPSQYSFALFRQAVRGALVTEFGNNLIHPDNKCIKLDAHNTYTNADIVPCFSHRLYKRYPAQGNPSYYEGIQFQTQNGDWVVNFPNQHYDSLTTRSTQTNGKIKEYIRLFKALKEALVENGRLGENVAPSYYIENLLYNVPNRFFTGTGTYHDRFVSILEVLIQDFNSRAFSDYMCANGINILVHENAWNQESLRQYLLGLIFIRDNNEF